MYHPWLHHQKTNPCFPASLNSGRSPHAPPAGLPVAAPRRPPASLSQPKLHAPAIINSSIWDDMLLGYAVDDSLYGAEGQAGAGGTRPTRSHPFGILIMGACARDLLHVSFLCAGHAQPSAASITHTHHPKMDLSQGLIKIYAQHQQFGFRTTRKRRPIYLCSLVQTQGKL